MVDCEPHVYLVSETPKNSLELELDGCEPLCRCWGSNLGALQEQLALLTTELSLQPKNTDLRHIFVSACVGLCTDIWAPPWNYSRIQNFSFRKQNHH